MERQRNNTGCHLLHFWDEETKVQPQSNNAPTQYDNCYASMTKISCLGRKGNAYSQKGTGDGYGEERTALSQTGCSEILGIPIKNNREGIPAKREGKW